MKTANVVRKTNLFRTVGRGPPALFCLCSSSMDATIYICEKQYDKRLILRSSGSCHSFGPGVFQGRLFLTKQLALHVTGWQPAGGGQHPLKSLIWRANGRFTNCVYYCISYCYYCIRFSTITVSLMKVKLQVVTIESS